MLDWTISRRYSDFEALRSRLNEFSTVVPSLPGKSWLGHMSSEFIQTRKNGLNAFLHDAIQLAWITDSNAWREFLDVTSHVPGKYLYHWAPIEIKAVRNHTTTGAAGATESYGVNDLVYLPKQLVMFMGMEDQRLLQKVDNFVTSKFRLPWDKAPPPRPVPLGCIKIHKVDETGAWRLMCSVTTQAGVVCLDYHQESMTLIAGLDDGAIHMYRVNPAYVEMELKKEIRNHEKQRCTAVYYHQRKQYILSAGRDKNFCIYDLRKDLLLSTTIVGGQVGAPAWISAMEVEEDADRVFIGTYASHIHIYDIANPTTPRLLHTLDAHTGSVRCLQYRRQDRYLFSGGFDAAAGIWSIPNGTDEAIARARSVGWLKDGANQKMKSIIFIPPPPNQHESRGLVITGQDGGYISIFDVSTGRLKCGLKGHAGAVVKLIHLADDNILITAGLDGVVKFWQIPLKPMTMEVGTGAATIAAINQITTATESIALTPSSSQQQSESSTPATSSSQHKRRKSSSLTPDAPPPTMASTSGILHKTSGADAAFFDVGSVSIDENSIGTEETIAETEAAVEVPNSNEEQQTSGAVEVPAPFEDEPDIF